MSQKIIKCTNLGKDLETVLEAMDYDELFVLTDENTYRLCFPLLKENSDIAETKVCRIPAGDDHKSLEMLSSIWSFLGDRGATRKSLLINLGGGMVTDIGGFAASAFKRGIRFVNIPTTLLGAVDAAVGGKTGINFGGLKNEIGVFSEAEAVLIDTEFLRTLDQTNILSGYAEMLKHSLIDSEDMWKKTLAFDLDKLDYERLSNMLFDSVKVKERVVKEDPTEKEIRKSLNFGHTVGHAFESVSIQSGHPILHGYAVAWGLACELYLSFMKTGFPKEKLIETVSFIRENYGSYCFACNSYARLYDLMRHDKKNLSATEINFTLLSDVGKIKINQTADEEEIFESLDFYKDYFHC